jgi:Ca-activated chloride channel family protein
MTFQNLTWLYFAIPLLLVLAVVRFWRRHFWGHSLVEQLSEEMGGPNPLLRFPKFLEALAVAFLLVALLGPVYPFSLNQIERGGLQIMFVLDLSQSMEEAIQRAGQPPPRPQATTVISPSQQGAQTLGPMLATPGSKMEAVKESALAFVTKRSGDAIGLVVFSNNGYLVTPATFDHESLSQYLLMTGTHTLVNEGFTAIGEGLNMANRFFAYNKEKTRRRVKGQVIVLFTDGDNNYGRDPLVEIERAKSEGTRIYMIGVALQPGASQQIAYGVPSTGGKYYDVRNPAHLEQAFADINNIEKGIFYTLQLRKDEPAYFYFVLAALACLALRLILNAVPQFVEIS